MLQMEKRYFFRGKRENFDEIKKKKLPKCRRILSEKKWCKWIERDKQQQSFSNVNENVIYTREGREIQFSQFGNLDCSFPNQIKHFVLLFNKVVTQMQYTHIYKNWRRYV